MQRVRSVFQAPGPGLGLGSGLALCRVRESPGPPPAPPQPAEDDVDSDCAGEGRAFPEISDKMYCPACQSNFDSRADQTEHYKLDWHRYNLRQRLMGAQPVTAESFETIADEICSISGSDSEEPYSDTEPEQLQCRSVRNVLAGEDPPGEDKPPGRRGQHVLFRSLEGEYLSVYRCILQGKQESREGEDEESLLSSLRSLNPQTIWVVLMTGGGHFAGAVFQGSEAIHHKTIHRYTVRAKQGSAQGARDGQNRSRVPKSAGASLRRYNEGALVKDVEDLLVSWSESLRAASAIFLRAPSYNKNIFFSGKEPALNRSDDRLRTIPFLTRRATFKEVKRVHATLSTMEIYARDTDVATIHSPQRRVWKQKEKAAGEASGSERDDCDREATNPADLPCSLEMVEESLGTLELKEFDVWPKKKRKKKKNEANVEQTIGREAPDSPEDGNNKTTQNAFTKGADPGTGPIFAEERDQAKKQPKNIRLISAGTPEEETERYRVRNELYTACKTGDMEHLQQLLCDVLPPRVTELGRSGQTDSSNQAAESAARTDREQGSEPCGRTEHGEESELGEERQAPGGLSTSPPGEDRLVSGPPREDGSRPVLVTAAMLCETLDEAGSTLLHVAAAAAQRAVLRLLMDAGCDPTVRDKRGQSAYAVSADKPTRNEFRRYMADHPGTYNYTKAQICAPLTSEIESKKAEKKQAQKTAKKLRLKEQKEEKKRIEEEQIEQKRFAAMSEREKRALAADKRFAQQLVNNRTNTRRCWLCGQSLLGRVPFEYLDYTFCTTHCLQEHRKQQRL